jgi:hypothetical protein
MKVPRGTSASWRASTRALPGVRPANGRGMDRVLTIRFRWEHAGKRALWRASTPALQHALMDPAVEPGPYGKIGNHGGKPQIWWHSCFASLHSFRSEVHSPLFAAYVDLPTDV